MYGICFCVSNCFICCIAFLFRLAFFKTKSDVFMGELLNGDRNWKLCKVDAVGKHWARYGETNDPFPHKYI